jgi:hypothetical protein
VSIARIDQFQTTIAAAAVREIDVHLFAEVAPRHRTRRAGGSRASHADAAQICAPWSR